MRTKKNEVHYFKLYLLYLFLSRYISKALKETEFLYTHVSVNKVAGLSDKYELLGNYRGRV